MASKGDMERYIKLKAEVVKYKPKREELKSVIRNMDLNPSERMKARMQLSEMRKGIEVKVRNRCMVCYYPRSYIRRFGLCRMCFKKYGSAGFLPGVVRGSW